MEGRWGHSLVATVPFPAVPGPAGQKVGRALVLHPLGKPQEDPHIVVGGFGGVGGAGDIKEGQCQCPPPPPPTSAPALGDRSSSRFSPGTPGEANPQRSGL